MHLLITFETVGAAFDFQMLMDKKQLPAELIQNPRCLGLSCAFSARINFLCEDIFEFLKINRVVYSKIYKIRMNHVGEELYEEMLGNR
ncbi:MAG: DUF3343 domain-containing protein [Spirochaetaceae bacterium]|jgi:hypothetical protein|nr:DUF3343 domain-containing protein [Spirochaetaceae bacterium]